ncbi:hypothetical protein FRC06_007021 [Ceratobasidium sp. 370]|nr:hypothetical protein FRC06_007021 [Ceratobasidium sp. 370]
MAPALETTALGPFVVPRVWTGLWQLSSPAWGTAPAARIKREMTRHVNEGYTAFADHYGSAEILFGQFRQTLENPDSVVGATKWCVFAPTEITREVVEDGVRERIDRMRTEHVDLLQFHWQNYDDKAYLKALDHLRDLQAEGMITAIGLCNFDTIRTDEICTYLGPGAIVSNQVQFSLIDTRPLDGMDDVCRKHGVKLLTYGSLCGGFLADKWLGAPEPDAYRETMTPSQRKGARLRPPDGDAAPALDAQRARFSLGLCPSMPGSNMVLQYLDMILKAWGTWSLFQSLLRVLRTVGDHHGGVSIANVSTRWVLQHDFVGAVIIGARLGVSEHTSDNLQTFSFRLTEADLAAIESVLDESNGRNLVRTIGDCGSEYR